MREPIYVGVVRLELHLPEARSLKEKRASVRPLVERIRNRHQVMMVESDHRDLHQRAGFAITALSTDPVDCEARLQRVRLTVDETWPGYVLEWDLEVLQLD